MYTTVKVQHSLMVCHKETNQARSQKMELGYKLIKRSLQQKIDVDKSKTLSLHHSCKTRMFLNLNKKELRNQKKNKNNKKKFLSEKGMEMNAQKERSYSMDTWSR